MGRSQRKQLEWSAAVSSFLGFLEGTGKATHTQENYKTDLVSFEEFMRLGLKMEVLDLARLTKDDFTNYGLWLKSRGLKTNTRRRRMLTLRRLIRFLTKRGKITLDVSDSIPAPAKLERAPLVVSLKVLLEAIQTLEVTSVLERRNRLLLWTLAESGALVSEVSHVSGKSITPGVPPQLALGGEKAFRTVPISEALAWELETETAALNPKQNHLFCGFNRYGPLPAPVSPRGVELLVRAFAPRLGFPELTPRGIRHARVLEWMFQGVSEEQIQEWLGLRSNYAFRAYRQAAALVRAKTETTSNIEDPKAQ